MFVLTSLLIVALAWTIYFINKSKNQDEKKWKILFAIIVFLMAILRTSFENMLYNFLNIWKILLIIAVLYGISAFKKYKMQDKSLKIALGATLFFIILWIMSNSHQKNLFISIKSSRFYIDKYVNIGFIVFIITIWFWYGVSKLKSLPTIFKLIVGLAGFDLISLISQKFTLSYKSSLEIKYRLIIYLTIIILWLFVKKMREKNIPLWLIIVTCIFTFSSIGSYLIM